MPNSPNHAQLDPAEITLYAVLWLFFLQLLSEFVEAIYAFGLLGTDIPPEIVAVLLLLAPAVLLLAPRQSGLLLPLVMAALVVFGRLALPLLETRARLMVSGAAVAAFMIWLPAQLAILSRYRRTEGGVALAVGLALSLALFNLLRAWHHGVDPSLTSSYPYIGWALGLVAVVLLATKRPQPPVLQPPPGESRFGALALHAIGVMSAVALAYLAFAAPNVIARWVGLGYPLTVGLLGLALTGALLATALRPALLAQLSRRALVVWNALFIAALSVTILSQQVRFPPDPGGYPLPARPDTSLVSTLAACALLLLSPVLLINLGRSSRAIIAAVPKRRSLGGAFALGGLWLLVLILGHVFTTVYDYIPVVGPLWRNKFWLVYGLAAAGMAAPLLASTTRLRPGEPVRMPPGFAYAAGLAAVLAVAGAAATAARPATAAADQPTLRVATYNIQQGYRSDCQRGHADQLALLRSIDADVIGLQESDTNRISGGNADLVRYFANQLDMYSYYGPSPVAGTFGIALLSRYPIENPRTFYMYSEGEQTAAVAGQVAVGGQTYNVYVTHLGNGGPLIQQEQVLVDVREKDNVVLMGDFNFRPETAQYALTTTALADTWLLQWPSGADDQGNTYPQRIDHIFVSPNVAIRNARYLDSPASDHPLLVIELGD